MAVLLGAIGMSISETNRSTEPQIEEQLAQPESTEQAAAIASVAPFIRANSYGVTTTNLTVIENPRGVGQIVYVPEVQERLGQPVNLLWVVLGDQGYAVNGPSKNVTPDLPWPREAPKSVWEPTGLNRFVATETIAIAYGEESSGRVRP